MKKIDFTRRNFLSKLSFGLGTLGIAPYIKSDLINKLIREAFPQAMAASSQGIDYVIEIGLRAGYPINSSMFPHRGFALPTREPHSNCYAAPSEILNVDCGNGNTLYLTPAAQGLRPYASNIAMVNGISLGSRGHTSDFEVRSPNQNALTPAAIWANKVAPSVVVQGGVGWGYNANTVVNKAGNLQNVTPVSNAGDLRRLFQAPSFANLNNQEVRAITEAVSRINNGDMKLILQQRLTKTSVNAGVKSGDTAGTLLNGSIGDILNATPSMNSEFMVGQRPPRGKDNYQLRGPDLGEALMYAYLGFSNSLFNYFHFTQDTQDWHGFQQNGMNSGQQLTGQYFSDRLTAMIKRLKSTESLVAGQSMFDRTLIIITTEFTRGALAVRTGSNDPGDNPDNGTNGTVFIGGKVNGGTYGGITSIAAGPQGINLQGFDPISGALLPMNRGLVATSSIYVTMLEMMNVGMADRSAQGVSAPVLTCLIRR